MRFLVFCWSKKLKCWRNWFEIEIKGESYMVEYDRRKVRGCQNVDLGWIVIFFLEKYTFCNILLERWNHSVNRANPMCFMSKTCLSPIFCSLNSLLQLVLTRSMKCTVFKAIHIILPPFLELSKQNMEVPFSPQTTNIFNTFFSNI